MTEVKRKRSHNSVGYSDDDGHLESDEDDSGNEKRTNTADMPYKDIAAAGMSIASQNAMTKHNDMLTANVRKRIGVSDPSPGFCLYVTSWCTCVHPLNAADPAPWSRPRLFFN